MASSDGAGDAYDPFGQAGSGSDQPQAQQINGGHQLQHQYPTHYQYHMAAYQQQHHHHYMPYAANRVRSYNDYGPYMSMAYQPHYQPQQQPQRISQEDRQWLLDFAKRHTTSHSMSSSNQAQWTANSVRQMLQQVECMRFELAQTTTELERLCTTDADCKPSIEQYQQSLIDRSAALKQAITDKMSCFCDPEQFQSIQLMAHKFNRRKVCSVISALATAPMRALCQRSECLATCFSDGSNDSSNPPSSESPNTRYENQSEYRLSMSGSLARPQLSVRHSKRFVECAARSLHRSVAYAHGHGHRSKSVFDKWNLNVDQAAGSASMRFCSTSCCN
jgi:hypothetical protein